jgi:hypothetical protein
MRAGSTFTSDVHDKKGEQQAVAAALDADHEEGMDVE